MSTSDLEGWTNSEYPRFVASAETTSKYISAGLDSVVVVDLPPEETPGIIFC